MNSNNFKWHAAFTVLDTILAIYALYMFVNVHFLGPHVLYAMFFAFFVWRTWDHGRRAWALR